MTKEALVLKKTKYVLLYQQHWEKLMPKCPQKFDSCLLAIVHSFNDNILISSTLLDYFKHSSSYLANSTVHAKLVEEGMRIKKVLLLKGVKSSCPELFI